MTYWQTIYVAHISRARHMYNFQGLLDRYVPVTRYHIVFENPSHLYWQEIYIVYNERRNNPPKKRECKSLESGMIRNGWDVREKDEEQDVGVGGWVEMRGRELRRLIVEHKVQGAWISVCVCLCVCESEWPYASHTYTHTHTERVAHEDKCSDLA